MYSFSLNQLVIYKQNLNFHQSILALEISIVSHLVDKIDKLENLGQIFRKYRHDRNDELLATVKKEVLFEKESPIDHVSLACELEDGSIICMKC